MEVTQIQTLMDQFEDSDIRELQLDDNKFHLYLSKNKSKAPQKVVNDVASQKEEKTSTEELNPAPKISDEKVGTEVKSPIVGVVYLQAKPGQPAYVKVGDHVEKGDTICIIEAMKMMTEVKSKVSGKVKEIKVENEDLVEVDQPLIVVEED